MPYALRETPLVRSEDVVGASLRVPLLDGTQARSINLDNAASTPALRPVRDVVNELLDVYSSVHRGTGYKSQLCTRIYEQAREIVGRFVGARAGQHTVIFTKNTTEAINKLARRIPFKPGHVVITSEIEHHANDLPWRRVAQVVYARTDDHGALDEGHVAELLRRYAGRVRLVAVSGGSNVTGTIPAIHRLAVLAHAAGAEIAVDAAQLAPHRAIDLGGLADPAHIDYVAFSGHKLYAPFGGGALVGRADTFAEGAPDLVGGGAVATVTAEDVVWAEGSARDEAGTPNVIGAVSLAAAINVLESIGLDAIAAHEAELTAYALQRLAEVPGLRIYGDSDPAHAAERLGVIPFALEGFDHRLVAAILSHEYGIAVRAGSFCAQPYVRRLIGHEAGAAVGCGQDAPAQTPLPTGLIRASFGLYNTLADVDILVAGLSAVAQGEIRGEYVADGHGGFQPTNSGEWEKALGNWSKSVLAQASRL